MSQPMIDQGSPHASFAPLYPHRVLAGASSLAPEFMLTASGCDSGTDGCASGSKGWATSSEGCVSDAIL